VTEFRPLKPREFFLFFKTYRPPLESPPAPSHPSVQRVPGFFHGRKAAGVWSNHWLLLSTEVKNEWIYSSSPPYAFMSWKRKTLPSYIYTGCHRRKGPNFWRVFLMLNYTDITQNTYIKSWTITEIMAREKCGHLAFPRTVRLQLSSALTVREECVTYFFDGTSSAQRDKIAFHYCRYVQCLVTLRTTEIWVRVFL